ncbi:MAG TPA: DivIVA domain-containing protein [Solirubrobacteraceae bacterium]|nr:DivIVA domain-containing protein [Solirubrobacteraceae bacterium]
MNNFHRPHGGLQEADASDEAPRSPFSDLAGRFANWMTGADQLTVDDESAVATRPARSPEPLMSDEPEPAPAAPAPGDDGDSARFALAPFGYNRTAVDEHLATLERELDELRAKHAPMASITDELERIGEQTASILVVAHDQANETTRLAQEQAERCVADAAANAVQMTADAKTKLRDLDAETDAVWRERERLLEDVRVVSAALTNLADQASERFPAEPTPSTGSFEKVAAPSRGLWEQTDDAIEARRGDDGQPEAIEPQATQPFAVLEDDGEVEGMPAQPGDTGSWLVGLEPPDLER